MYLTSPDTQIDTPRSELEVEAERLKAEAEKIRLEAEKLDVSLALRKIESIENKLSNREWLKKHPAEAPALDQQLQDLNKRLRGQQTTGTVAATKPSVTINAEQSQSGTDSSADKNGLVGFEKSPISGFDEIDLALYLPVAEEIEARLPNATIKEKVEAFRTAPELQEHFKKKIQSMLLQPMQDIQKLEELKNKYLYTTSSVEKKQIKREIEQLERAVDNDGPFAYSESIYRGLPPLTEEEVSIRLDAMTKLPLVLQALYKRRLGVDDDDPLRLAIELDHYAQQLQLLEQVASVAPLTSEKRRETVKAIESLPMSLRDRLAQNVGLEDGKDIDKLVEELTAGANDPAWGSLQQIVQASSMADLPEYNDIEFVDRSRYVEEFYPCVARLEGQHPSKDEIDQFVADVIGKKTFMVSTKPERVVGGYYVRGENLISDDEGGSKLVEKLRRRLESSTLSEKLLFFYLPDPAPLSDEELELGYGERPLLLVTRKNATAFYQNSSPLRKTVVTGLGLSSMALFGFATSEMQPYLQERLDAALAASGGDLSWLVDTTSAVFLSLSAILLAHETAHRVVAWKDKARKNSIRTFFPFVQIVTKSS